jgi:hypothetical protein
MVQQLELDVAHRLAALAVRYRRAGQVERQQMKWLFLATTVFVAAYLPSAMRPILRLRSGRAETLCWPNWAGRR